MLPHLQQKAYLPVTTIIGYFSIADNTDFHTGVTAMLNPPGVGKV
jgi:hypothetical protein